MGVTPKHCITSLKMNGRLRGLMTHFPELMKCVCNLHPNPLSFPQSLAGIHSLIKIGLLFMYVFS